MCLSNECVIDMFDGVNKEDVVSVCSSIFFFDNDGLDVGIDVCFGWV
jgi:hypothetical protein